MRDHPLSLLTGLRHADDFLEVERYVMFVGASRSGHSLVGSLLNAHPEVVVAHQLHALRYVAAGFNRRQLFAMILRTDRRYGRRGRVSNKGRFSYTVPNQWQGRYRRLRVIGDKRGASSTTLLQAHPELLGRLRTVVDVPVHLVHVVRNPFDNIATMAKRFHVELDQAADRYFGLCEGANEVCIEAGADRWLDLRHEEVIEDPAAALETLCRFLDLPPGQDYLRDCADIVYRTPHQSRHETTWSPALVDDVKRRMAAFPFLEGYCFDEPRS